ncbi:MAG TPA: HepT-like ribonuclease domain-containing protein [Chitinophagaceae bacterium]
MSNMNYRLTLILNAITIIDKRMKKIKISEDFIKDDNGETILDSINARLQTIGENANKIPKSDKEFFSLQLQMDPLPIIDFRNIISHEYELLDYQIIYKICTENLFILKQKIETFLSNNNETV